ncbi:putative ribonuclease H protein [Camellia lanceoleosa]|uniref:Ribonuclease H protein n=1 Tax=Camellia lanceoleosa TaxID=1840588 RepID=A0ACC0GJ71_9ERIC|nr:putative ribonuclease H protein [Camellia lanceoleosa]
MGNLMVFKLLEIESPVSQMDFTWSPFWVQVHGLPLEKMTRTNGEAIGKRLGRLIRVDGHSEELLLNRCFFRIRVELDITKPLPRGFFLKKFGRSTEETKELWIDFKIKKLSDFCFDCGRIGHDQNNCKFVTRDEGRTSGYGPELKTGIIRTSGFSVEYSRKQVEETKRSSRAMAHRPRLTNWGLSSSPAREDGARVGETSKTFNVSAHGRGPETAERHLVVLGGDTESVENNPAGPDGDVVNKEVDTKKSISPNSSHYKRVFQSIQLSTPLPDGSLISKVEDVIDYTCKRWKVDVLQTLVSEFEMEAIRTISLPLAPKEDALICYFESTGVYSVKSRYHVALSETQNQWIQRPFSSFSPLDTFWKLIWSLKVPPKIRHLWWRACKNVLASRENLFRKRCAPSNVYPICQCKIESVEYLLFDCGWVRAVWFGSDLNFKVDCGATQSIEKWLCELVANSKNEEDRAFCLGKVSWIGWFIWKDRNNYIFNHYPVEPSSTLHRARVAMAEYEYVTISPVVSFSHGPSLNLTEVGT